MDKIVSELRKIFKVVTVWSEAPFGTSVLEKNWYEIPAGDHLVICYRNGRLYYNVDNLENEKCALKTELLKKYPNVLVGNYFEEISTPWSMQFRSLSDFMSMFEKNHAAEKWTSVNLYFNPTPEGLWVAYRGFDCNDNWFESVLTKLRTKYTVTVRDLPFPNNNRGCRGFDRSSLSWYSYVDDICERFSHTHMEIYHWKGAANEVVFKSYPISFGRILFLLSKFHPSLVECEPDKKADFIKLKDWRQWEVKWCRADDRFRLLEIGYDSGRIYYKCETSDPLYETLTLSCEHLAYAKPRFCGDRLPRCSCNLPRNITIAWTQQESDNKIVFVRVVPGTPRPILRCMSCNFCAGMKSLAFVRNPLALIDKNKRFVESGVYCIKCYETMCTGLKALVFE